MWPSPRRVYRVSATASRTLYLDALKTSTISKGTSVAFRAAISAWMSSSRRSRGGLSSCANRHIPTRQYDTPSLLGEVVSFESIGGTRRGTVKNEPCAPIWKESASFANDFGAGSRTQISVTMIYGSGGGIWPAGASYGRPVIGFTKPILESDRTWGYLSVVRS